MQLEEGNNGWEYMLMHTTRGHVRLTPEMFFSPLWLLAKTICCLTSLLLSRLTGHETHNVLRTAWKCKRLTGILAIFSCCLQTCDGIATFQLVFCSLFFFFKV